MLIKNTRHQWFGDYNHFEYKNQWFSKKNRLDTKIDKIEKKTIDHDHNAT